MATDRLAVVELIGATTTKTGLRVESTLDTRSYRKGIKVSKAQIKCLDIVGDRLGGDGSAVARRYGSVRIRRASGCG